MKIARVVSRSPYNWVRHPFNSIIQRIYKGFTCSSRLLSFISRQFVIMSIPITTSSKTSVEQLLEPDAYLLYSGKEPTSYKAVLTCMVSLLEQYSTDQSSTTKDALRQLGAHLFPFASGTRADISTDKFFNQLKAAANAAMKAMTTGQHERAVSLGLARVLKLPKDIKNGKLEQDHFMPFLKPKFVKKVVAAVQTNHRYAQLDPDEVLATMMLFVGEFIDNQLQAEGLDGQVSNFMVAKNKDFMRVMVKLLSDYASSDNPHAKVFDIVRRSATAPLEDQERFIAHLDARANFVKIRTKETLTDLTADIKFVNVCMAYTPPKINYKSMLAQDNWETMVAAVVERNHIPEALTESALTLLGHKAIASKPVRMIIEFQMYVPEFLETKRALHAIYKFGRPENLLDLTKDLAKFATNQGMQFKADEGTYNEAYLLRMKGDSLKLGLEVSDKTLKLQDVLKLSAAIQKRGETYVCDHIKSCFEAFNCKTLE